MIAVIIALLVLATVPVLFALGLPMAAGLAHDGLWVIAQEMAVGLNPTALPAIPMLILAGELFHEGGMTARLLRLFNALFGWIPGGLGLSAVVVSALSAGAGGAANVNGVNAVSVSVGRNAIEPMVGSGLERRSAAALVAGGGALSILVPPSITMVLLGVVAQLSFRRLFLAAAVPALLMMLVLGGLACIRGPRKQSPARPAWDRHEAERSALAAIPALLAPVLVLGGLLTGIFGVLEAAFFALLYALLAAVTYEGVEWNRWWRMLVRAGWRSGVLLGLVAVGQMIFALYSENDNANYLDLQVSALLGPLLRLLPLFVIATLLVFWAAGAVMDAIPAILVFGPFFQQPPSGHLGLAQLAGLDPYHSAILLLMAVGIATMTPPVGTAWSGPARLLAIGRQGAVRPAIPILVALLATFAVLAWQPGLTLWLPDRVLGPGA